MKSPNLEDLTKEALEHLYLIERKTEGEIAKIYQTYQVKIGRLRQKYGIPTISKCDRLDLPEQFTNRQHQIFLGSMLGDGSLFPTGSETAGYEEYHSDAQREYLDWKAKEWGPFVTSIHPRLKVSNGKEFKGSVLRLAGCRQFRYFRDMFYPDQSGDKTFKNFPISQVTGLSIAVWFMDDGSRTSGGHLRFSISPRPEDQDMLLRILDKFSIQGEVYHSEGNHELLVSNRTNLTRLLDLISPYIPECMNHKLDLRLRSLGASPRDKLTPSVLAPLVERGMNIPSIARAFNVSLSSTRRAIGKAGLVVSRNDSRLTIEEATTIISSIPKESVTEEGVLSILSRTTFPESVPSKGDLYRDMGLLQQSTTYVSQDEVVGMPQAGIRTCDYFFGYRLDGRYKTLPSVREAWEDPICLKKAIQFQLRVGDPVLPKNVFRALKAQLKTPTNFRPGVAKAIVERFCPEGGLVLDPCAGYGGRAAGTLSSGRHYIGVDPHPKAKEAYRGLFEFMGKSAIFHNQPFEDTDLSDLEADLVFTSPPYFSVERYSDDTSQSWVRYKTWSTWVEGFYRVLIERAFRYLRPGGTFCLNVADGRKMPMVSVGINLANQVGFMLEGTVKMHLGRFGKHARYEPILIFRKPE